MSGEIVTRTSTVPAASAHILADDEFERVWRMSKALAASGMFKDVTQAEQAFGRILLGRDLGLTPTQALMSVDVVRGNVQVRAVRLAAWVRQHPDYDYKVIEHDEQHCVIDFYFKGEVEGTSAFSMEDAKAAGLLGKEGPWKAHPRNMVFSRAMSNGVKWFCPDVTGGIPVYTEADSFVDSTATDITAGEGSGEPPEWDLDPELVAEVEAWLETAAALGHEYEVGAVRMLLNGRPQAVEGWLLQEQARLAKGEEKAS